MTEFLKSQLITSIALALFYSIYALFLKKETFFKANRYVLLAILAISFAAPYVKISTNNSQVELIQRNEIVRTTRYALVEPTAKINTATLSVSEAPTTVKSPEFNAENLWNYLYLMGVSGLFLKFIYSLFGIYKIHRKSVYNSNGYYEISEEISSFSFFKSIYLSACLSDAERTAILIHEKVHTKQNHSLDSVFFALAKCLQWYNPFIYLLEREVKEVHEYLADSITSEQSKIEYMELLLNQTLSAQLVDLGNNFNSSTILKRLKMLDKSKSSGIKALKYALALLPVALCMVLFSCGKETFSIPKAGYSKSQSQVLDYYDSPYTLVSSRFIDSLIYKFKETPKEALEKKIAAKIIIGFDVDVTGDMINLRYVNGAIAGGTWSQDGVGYGLDEEAIRIVKKLAEHVKLTPAQYNGKPCIIYIQFGANKEFAKYLASPEERYSYCGGNEFTSCYKVVNPCKRKNNNEPSFFYDEHYNQLYHGLVDNDDLLAISDSGKAIVSFAIDEKGRTKDLILEQGKNSPYSKTVLKAVADLEGLEVNGFDHKNKRYSIEIYYRTGLKIHGEDEAMKLHEKMFNT